MRILVTGREGQVARSLAERAEGREIVFAARPDFDLTDPASIERTVREVGPDVIISAAAYTAVDKAEDEPEFAMRINGEAPGTLASAGARVGAPIIHLSTDYVFDGTLGRPWHEDDPVAPLGAYGATKLAGEQAIAASGARYAIVRTAWVYSPFGNNFVKTMLRLAESRDDLNVVEDQVGCPTSALDIADALFAVMDAWADDPAKGANGVYHFAGDGATDWASFARTIFTESARLGGPTARVHGIPTSAYPTKAKRPANSRLDCSRFIDTFGHRAPDWRDSLRPVVARLTAN